jgi:hypothetical protein
VGEEGAREEDGWVNAYKYAAKTRNFNLSEIAKINITIFVLLKLKLAIL